MSLADPVRSPVTTVPLPRLVKHTRDSLCEFLTATDSTAAEWVDSVRRAKGERPSVVVVGETNRGKSSLVNALLNQPGLSPVDIDVATSTYVAFEHDESFSARAHYAGSGEAVDIEWDELPRWTSLTEPLPEGALPPRSVRVHGPMELLTRFNLVDTPGVGGLESMHGELAREAAATATALLFVVDASAPFTRGELEFLRSIGDRVETVMFALTKTDQHRGWREIVTANRELLTRHAPRFAEVPMHPVSARLWELVARAPSEESAELLRERSGIAELRTALDQLVGGRGAMLAEANTMRALVTALGELSVRLAAEKRALTVGEDEAAGLRSRRDELAAARRSAARGWQIKLRGEIQRARVETTHEVARHTREVRTWFRRQVEAANRSQLAELPPQVDAALQLASGRVSAALADRLTRVAEVTLAELFSPDELAVIRAQFARGAHAPVVLHPPDKRPATAEDKLLVFMGVSGGLGIGRAAALPLTGVGVGLLSPFVIPATIVLGLGAGWWISRVRKHGADKQHLKQWLTEAITDARSTLEQLVSEQLISAEQQLNLALDEALSRRIDSIEAELRQVDKALRMDAAERAQRLRVVNQRCTDAEAGRAKAESLLASIRGLRDRPA